MKAVNVQKQVEPYCDCRLSRPRCRFSFRDKQTPSWKMFGMIKCISLIPRIALALACTVSLSLAQETKKEEKKPAATEEKKPVSTTNEVAVIKTSEGEMVLEFWPEVAPGHVENFKKLAKSGFYDGQAFHRIIKG